MGSVVVLEEFMLIQTRRWIVYRWSTHTFSHHRLYTLYTVVNTDRRGRGNTFRHCAQLTTVKFGVYSAVRTKNGCVLPSNPQLRFYGCQRSEHRNAIILTLTAVIVHSCQKLTL